MQNEAVSVQLTSGLYLDLVMQLRKSGDMRSPDQVAAIAIRTWLATHLNRPSGRGYQWKELFLPDGTQLRMRYQRIWHYAAIDGDQLCYDGESVSPRDWTFLVSGSVRNAWRDIWVRRTVCEGWTQAATLRSQHAGLAAAPGANRRFHARRQTD